MSSRDKARSSVFAPTAASISRRSATKKTMSSSSNSSLSAQAKPQTSKQITGSSKKSTHKTQSPQPSSSTSGPERTTSSTTSKSVIDGSKKVQRRAHESRSLLTGSKANSRRQAKDSGSQDGSSSSSQEMTITSSLGDHPSCLVAKISQGELSTCLVEQETNIDHNQVSDDDESTTLLESFNATSSGSEGAQAAALTSQTSVPERGTKTKANTIPDLPADWEQHVDKNGVYFWHRPTGVIQRHRPHDDRLNKPAGGTKPIVLYHDDEEINQSSVVHRGNRTSSDEDDYTALESGAALTLADEATATTLNDANSFVVYPLGCCDFDETHLVSINSTKAIQRCILRLLNTVNEGENQCWGLNQSQPILMRLMDDHIQFTDIVSQSLIRSQPIQTMRTWAVDDDNNFAFVVEELPQVESSSHHDDSIDYALLNGPTFVCYVFSSADENDDMSLKVATKLNKQITRYRDQLTNRMEAASKQPQQMIDTKPVRLLAATNNRLTAQDNDQTDADEDFEDQFETGDADLLDDDYDDDLADSSEVTLKVRYIGKVQVPRPMGIDVLNVAIDKCLADASKIQMNRLLSRSNSDCNQQEASSKLVQTGGQLSVASPLAEVKIHVSPSSVIVEDEQTGEIVVECRIRYLTFMGISRRDIRWCGFIMQNTTNQSFVAHCFECYPTAGEVCEAIQMSCSRMYEKMVKRGKMKQQDDEAASIVPKSSKIRDTLVKTLSKIKLTPII